MNFKAEIRPQRTGTGNSYVFILDRQGFDDWINKQEPGPCEIEITREKRSLKQNSLYWKRCQVFADEFGCSKESIHQALMGRAGFGKLETVRMKDNMTIQVFRKYKSSTDLDKKEFNEKLIAEQDRLAGEFDPPMLLPGV